jgi:hypothetical protein
LPGFCENGGVRQWRIGIGLLLGLAAVLAAPSWLLWNTFKSRPWDSTTMLIRFDSVRYERAGLVFTYLVENRTWRDARFLPEQTEIKTVQDADLPLAGYPNMILPLDVPAHTLQRVEIRLEVPSPRPYTQPGRDTAGVEDSLRNLDGFELVDSVENVKLRFPRGW